MGTPRGRLCGALRKSRLGLHENVCTHCSRMPPPLPVCLPVCLHHQQIFGIYLCVTRTHTHTHTRVRHVRCVYNIHTSNHARQQAGMQASRQACRQTARQACKQACMQACTDSLLYWLHVYTCMHVRSSACGGVAPTSCPSWICHVCISRAEELPRTSAPPMSQ